MIIPIFSKPVFITKLNFETNKILEEVKKEEFKKITTSDYLPTASRISKSIQILQKPQFQELKKLIIEKFKEYVYEHLRYHEYKFFLKDSWLTKTCFNEKSEVHNHRNSDFSAVLYLQTKGIDAKISFIDFSHKRTAFETKENNVFNSEMWDIPVEDKKLIFFPSEVHHKITINKTHEERISLAMNFNVQ